MQMQLTKRVSVTFLKANGVLDYSSTYSEGPVVLEEWVSFKGQDILESVRSHCPETNITAEDLEKWHRSLPESTAVFTDILVGSIHKRINRSVETTSFHLDVK